MTGRSATLSMDGTPISQADVERMHEEERLHAERQCKAARAVAAAARDVDDARMLLEMLGLDHEVVVAARRPRDEKAASTRRRSAAA